MFIGPPFHTLPLAQYIDYPSFSVFFNVTEPTWGDPSQIAWTLDLGQRASHPTDSQFWVPDIPNIQARRASEPSLYFYHALPTLASSEPLRASEPSGRRSL